MEPGENLCSWSLQEFVLGSTDVMPSLLNDKMGGTRILPGNLEHTWRLDGVSEMHENTGMETLALENHPWDKEPKVTQQTCPTGRRRHLII